MNRYRRKPPEERKKPSKRRWWIAGAALVVAVVLGFVLFGGGAEAPQHAAWVAPPEHYALTERSWANLPSPPPIPEPDVDPEEVERQRWLADQWKNMDISFAEDR